jgi:hypothetical protein
LQILQQSLGHLAIFAAMHKVTIELFGLQLLEPSTYLSDLFLATFSFGLFWSLRNLFLTSNIRKVYSGFFLFMGCSTLVGGHAHLLGNYIDHYYFHAISWTFSSIGLFFMQQGSLMDFSEKTKKYLQPLFMAQLAISIGAYFGYQMFAVDSVSHDHVGTPGFAAVKVSQAVGYLGFIVPLQVTKFIREKDSGASLILMGLVVSIGALLVQSKQWGFGPNFNHNDVAHVILAFVFYLFYWGIRLKIVNNEELANDN